MLYFLSAGVFFQYIFKYAYMVKRQIEQFEFLPFLRGNFIAAGCASLACGYENPAFQAGNPTTENIL
jgi:hypothetical protein